MLVSGGNVANDATRRLLQQQHGASIGEIQVDSKEAAGPRLLIQDLVYTSCSPILDRSIAA